MVAIGFCKLSASLARSVKVELPGAAALRRRKPGGEDVRVDTAGEKQLSGVLTRVEREGVRGETKVLIKAKEGKMSLRSQELLVEMRS
jgi:hypothetical protein